MKAWKDDQIVSDALNFKIARTPPDRRKLWMLCGLGAVSLGLAAGSLYLRNPGAAALASRQVLAANSESSAAVVQTQIKTEGDAARAPATSSPIAKIQSEPHTKPFLEAAIKPDVVILPPVTLHTLASPQGKASATGTVKSIVPKSTAVSASPKGPFASVYAALTSGKPQTALDLLIGVPAGADGSAEKKEALILQGRALLALGKMADARQKFEPLAFATPETETGADALLGNFLCQAGTLSRCRESELELVRNGAESWGSALSALEEARRIEDNAKGELPGLEKARMLFQQALDSQRLEEKDETECLAHLTALTDKLVLDPKCACTAPKAVFHKVEPGDNAEKIARAYKVNQGQIKKINRLNDKLTVRFGQTLKILPGDVFYKVSRSRLTGTLYIDGVFIRRYPVGIGPGDATPVGGYVIERKVVNPDWYYEGKRIAYGEPGNILGNRWMGFAANENGQGNGLGVHGTSLPESVPGRESKGCVRMHNADVEELYDLMPQGGKVQIFE